MRPCVGVLSKVCQPPKHSPQWAAYSSLAITISPVAKRRETVSPGEPTTLERSLFSWSHGSSLYLGLPGFSVPAVPPKMSLAIYRRGGPTSGSRRPPGVVRVYKPFLACHSRSGRQSLLATSTGPGPRDNLAAIVVQAYRPGHQATKTWTSIDAAFQSSQREETPFRSGESLQALSCLPLPVRSPMPAGDTNAARSS
ncbi:hypothetical protein MRX96_042202 [Rhipicephalus microplus]